ncbi:hypothetical protein D3C80_1297290 [compost metagenome]
MLEKELRPVVEVPVHTGGCVVLTGSGDIGGRVVHSDKELPIVARATCLTLVIVRTGAGTSITAGTQPALGRLRSSTGAIARVAATCRPTDIFEAVRRGRSEQRDRQRRTAALPGQLVFRNPLEPQTAVEASQCTAIFTGVCIRTTLAGVTDEDHIGLHAGVLGIQRRGELRVLRGVSCNISRRFWSTVFSITRQPRNRLLTTSQVVIHVVHQVTPG